MNFNDVYRGKRVLITGETGFKGSWLALWLHSLGAEVYGLSKGLPTGPCLFNLLDLRNKIKSELGDINDLTSVTGIIKKVKPDFVFHLAAQAIVSQSYQDPVETFQTNVMGTINIMEAIRQSDISCMAVFVTSDKCYHNDEQDRPFVEDDPLGGKDPYSASKGAAEVVIRSYYHSFFKDGKVRIGSGRAGNVIGGGDWAPNRIVPDCVRSWDKNEKVVLRRPDAIRPWQHVLEPLSGYLTLGEKLHGNENINGESFNFGPDPTLKFSVGDLVSAIASVWSEDDRDNLVELQVEKSFDESHYLRLNSDKAQKVLDWSSRLDFNETTGLTSKWYYQYLKKEIDAYQLCMQDIEFYSNKKVAVN